jgi:4-hydroxy-3-polyprenylbenzoate decarboxylase
MYRDLREFIAAIESADTLRRIAGAAPHLEIGAITEVAAGRPECPALLFDELPGYPAGMRVLTNAMTTPRRAALALGLDPDLAPIDLLRAWMVRRQTLAPCPPVPVADAPLLEHSVSGADVDLARLPAPTWHARDGGPYIGSGSIVVMRDPDDGSVNASIYRVQVHGPSRVTVQFDHEGRHGAILARKYWDRRAPCPIAVVNGVDPSLFIAGFEYLPLGASEYAFAGAIRGAPVEVIAGPATSLPLPARAESALEGVLLPTSEVTVPEGPFGEFTGYYASEARPCAVMEVTALHHRTDPILPGRRR